MIKFLPSYVGSKAFWVERLRVEIEGKHIVEPFCGSAVISANLSASNPVLNDSDFFIAKILSNFNELIVPETFSPTDYFATRPLKDWWRYSFCLQKMSFSGVFRYSSKGYNVPIKDKEKSVSIRPEYKEALKRWETLRPLVSNGDYSNVSPLIRKESIVIVDPPYESTQASYNTKGFNYHRYWEWVRLNENAGAAMYVFDFESNLPFMALETKKSRVNGARAGNSEGYFKFEDSFKEGHKGEREFAEFHKDTLEWINKPMLPDFRVIKSGALLELKSDYFNTNRTPNFFFERYSDLDRKTPGGPWQAMEKGAKWFVYYFPANKICFIFNTKGLVERLEEIINWSDFSDIPNKTWTTRGFCVKRKLLEDIYTERLLSL